MPSTSPIAAPHGTTAPVRPDRVRRSHPASRIIMRTGWTIMVLLALYYVRENALPWLDPLSEQRASPRSVQHLPALLTHIVTAMVALLLGPLQFWGALRNRYLSVHRWTGRAYLCAVLIGATASLYLTVFHPNPAGPVFRSGVAGLAGAWLAASLMAYLAIRRGNVREHREWMIRSYAVTFGFVMFRIGASQLQGMGLTPAEVAGINAWICWAVPLLVVEIALSIHRQRQWARAHWRPGVEGRPNR